MNDPSTGQWVTNYRSRLPPDSDSSGDERDTGAISGDSRLLMDLDISSRKETVNYQPNPFSIAKINASTRSQRVQVQKEKEVVEKPLPPPQRERRGTIDYLLDKMGNKKSDNSSDLHQQKPPANIVRNGGPGDSRMGLNIPGPSSRSNSHIVNNRTRSPLRSEDCDRGSTSDAVFSTSRPTKTRIPDSAPPPVPIGHQFKPESPMPFSYSQITQTAQTSSESRDGALRSDRIGTARKINISDFKSKIPDAYINPVPPKSLPRAPIPEKPLAPPRVWDRSTEYTLSLASRKAKAKCYDFSENGDENWSTLPSKKKFKPRFSSYSFHRTNWTETFYTVSLKSVKSQKSGIKTSRTFRLPIPVNPIVKTTGMSANSSARVIAFLPPPLLPQQQKEDNVENGRNSDMFSSPRTSPVSLRSFSFDAENLSDRCSSPPTSDSLVSEGDIYVQWDYNGVSERYSQTRKRIEMV